MLVDEKYVVVIKPTFVGCLPDTVFPLRLAVNDCTAKARLISSVVDGKRSECTFHLLIVVRSGS